MAFIKLITLIIIGTWSALRGAEGAFALWVKRSVRVHDLGGVAAA
jgi:hypothetical protein